MTKREYLEGALRTGGMTGRIYGSIKELRHVQGSSYAGILRVRDRPARTKSKKYYGDQEGGSMLRKTLYQCETTYNVVIAAATEAAAETVLEGFLKALGRGYYDDGGNWVAVDPVETDWVDEEDSVMKSKVAVQVAVICRYGLYTDEAAGKLPEGASIELNA